MNSMYDYVIVGGGTAGLVLANRLSEDKDTTVAVIEAGRDAASDPRSLIPALWTSTFGTELDWNFGTVPQSGLDGRRIGHHQGRALGGSSSINAQALIAFSAADIDIWESDIGLENWNFATLAPYLQKVFDLTPPADDVGSHINAAWATSWAAGSKGLVKSCFPDTKEGLTPRAWIDTFEALGVPLTASPLSGKYSGAYISPATINSSSKTRSSSATTYLSTAADRENLAIITGATVKKIILEEHEGVQTATGIQYISEGIEHTIRTRKDVIVSAGALNSPKLLELSGIGDPAVLQRAGIRLLVENKYVGTNLQDHLLAGISFEAVDGLFTSDDFLRGNAGAITAAQTQYIADQSGPFASSGLTQFAYLPTMDFKHDKEALARILNSLENSPTSHALDSVRAQHLSKLLIERQEGTAQYFLLLAQYHKAGANSTDGFIPNPQPGNFLSPLVGLSHPLSTGTVHISSSDYNQPPAVDHNYLSNPVDLELHARHVRYIETIAQTIPLKSLLKPDGRRNDPLSYFDGSLEKAKAYVKATSDTNYHSSGTLAMAPKEKGGVVDGIFRVYGVDRLRVVDASVIPIIPQSNTQSLVYVLAERAADLIKRG